MSQQEFDLEIEEYLDAKGRAFGTGVAKAKLKYIKRALAYKPPILSIRQIAECFDVTQSFVLQIRKELKTEKPKHK